MQMMCPTHGRFGGGRNADKVVLSGEVGVGGGWGGGGGGEQLYKGFRR
jgi:hypothetical protein